MDDPEFCLVVEACRAAYEGRPPTARSGAVRWNRVLALADRHRVQALCWSGLGDAQQQVPDEIAEQFVTRSRQIVEANLQMLGECSRLRTSFAAAEVDLIFVKGLTLAALAYPSPMLKMGWDIDLLIDPGQLQMAAEVLCQAGFQRVEPKGSDVDALYRWHRRRKESVWFKSDSRFTVELHTRLADHPAILPAVGMQSARRLVTVAGQVELPTLGREELFAYLCVHGASSAWFRLKWLVDLAALLHREPADAIASLYERSQLLGAGRAADQALILLKRLFGLQSSGGLERRLERRLPSRWLASMAVSQLSDPREPTERLLGTASIHFSQTLLLPGWRFSLSELARQTVNIAARQPA